MHFRSARQALIGLSTIVSTSAKGRSGGWEQGAPILVDRPGLDQKTPAAQRIL